MNNTRTFLYHAHGSALGGFFTRPVSESIESQATVALPVVGGSGGANAKDFSHKDMVSFRNASTQVSGRYNENTGTHTTEVSCFVEGLNVQGRVKADRLSARLTSERRLDEEETRVKVVECHFDNLRIDGHLVLVEADDDVFPSHDTYRGFRTHCAQDGGFRSKVRQRFLWGAPDNTAPEFLKQRYNWHKQADALLDSDGTVPCCLVKRITCDCPGLKTYGNVFKLPDFGTIHVADLLFAPHRRQFTMLRLELGSPTAGSLSVVSVDANGVGYP